jgi:hypothetical protein
VSEVDTDEATVFGDVDGAAGQLHADADLAPAVADHAIAVDVHRARRDDRTVAGAAGERGGLGRGLVGLGRGGVAQGLVRAFDVVVPAERVEQLLEPAMPAAGPWSAYQSLKVWW